MFVLTKLIKMKNKPTIAISPVSHEYLKKGKEYEIIFSGNSEAGFVIKDDTGCDIICLKKQCAHINNLSWILK